MPSVDPLVKSKHQTAQKRGRHHNIVAILKEKGQPFYAASLQPVQTMFLKCQSFFHSSFKASLALSTETNTALWTTEE